MHSLKVQSCFIQRTKLRTWAHDTHACVLSHFSLCNPMDCSPPGSSVHGILQAGILDWVTMPPSRGPSPPRDQTHNSCIGRRVLYHQHHLGSPGHSLSNSSEVLLLQRGKEGARICENFCNTDQVVRTSKDYCYLKKTSHLKLRKWTLFYV